MDLHDIGFPPSPARLQGFTPCQSPGVRAMLMGRRELDAACLAPRLCAFCCVKCGVNSGDRVHGKVTSGGVGSCQPARWAERVHPQHELAQDKNHALVQTWHKPAAASGCAWPMLAKSPTAHGCLLLPPVPRPQIPPPQRYAWAFTKGLFGHGGG